MTDDAKKRKRSLKRLFVEKCGGRCVECGRELDLDAVIIIGDDGPICHECGSEALESIRADLRVCRLDVDEDGNVAIPLELIQELRMEEEDEEARRLGLPGLIQETLADEDEQCDGEGAEEPRA